MLNMFRASCGHAFGMSSIDLDAQWRIAHSRGVSLTCLGHVPSMDGHISMLVVSSGCVQRLLAMCRTLLLSLSCMKEMQHTRGLLFTICRPSSSNVHVAINI